MNAKLRRAVGVTFTVMEAAALHARARGASDRDFRPPARMALMRALRKLDAAMWRAFEAPPCVR